jgi:polyisoprenoid-binding protein YceI
VVLVSALALALAASTGPDARPRLPEVYGIDTEHSSLTFRVPFMGLSEVRGEFGEFSGALLVGDDPARSSITVVVQVASINTHVQARDRHLRSPDFFDVEKHPVATFRSREVRAAKSGFVARGPLTLHGVTREIEVPFTVLHDRKKDAWGNTRRSYRGTFTLTRSEFDIKGTSFWNAEFDPGRFAVGDRVTLEFEMSGSIPNTASWKIPVADSLVAVAERDGVDKLIAGYVAVADTLARPDGQAVLTAAFKLSQRGHVGGAIELFTWATNGGVKAPTRIRSMALVILGETHLQQGDSTRAEASFAEALRTDANDPRAQEWMRWLGKDPGP